MQKKAKVGTARKKGQSGGRGPGCDAKKCFRAGKRQVPRGRWGYVKIKKTP